jgi:hypothetical protein
MARYATLAQFTQYGGFSTATSDSWDSDVDEALVNDLLTRASALIDTYCGRYFASDSDKTDVGSSDSYVTRKFDALEDVDGFYLYLDRDLCEISSITNGDSDATTVSSSDYVTEPRNDTPYFAIKLLSSTGTYWEYVTDPENAISVAGIWAYSKTAPNDIIHATVRLASWLYKQRINTDADLDRPLLTNAGVTIMPSQLPADVTRLLMPYRRTIVKAI